MVHYHLTIIADVVNEEVTITDVVMDLQEEEDLHQTEDGIDSIQQQHSIK